MGLVAIIDSGHGFETRGKNSKFHLDEQGRELLKENSVNEAVCNKLSMLFWLKNKEAHFVSNEWRDISLQERCRRENKIAYDVASRRRSSVFISVHADAFHLKNSAHGGRFFYYSDSGKEIAETMTGFMRDNGYPLELRNPARANFKVLRSTQSPAVLFEMGFMTTESDLEMLLDEEFRNKTAKLLYDALSIL